MNTISTSPENTAQAVSPRGRFFTDQTFHFETLRNAGYVFSRCADLGELMETTKQIAEGDVESWHGAWAATADRVTALAERTRDKISQGDAYMRASTYERLAEFLLPRRTPGATNPSKRRSAGFCSASMRWRSATNGSRRPTRTVGCARFIFPARQGARRNRSSWLSADTTRSSRRSIR